MIAVGVDVSSRKIAFGALTESGEVRHTTATVPAGVRGARRLVEVRNSTISAVRAFEDAGVVLVEVPWGSFLLLSVCAVVMEAIQAGLPGAVVLERQTTTWKLNSVGKGNASKGDVLEHAHGLGYHGDDQDVADAVCMAQAGWEEWARMEARA